MQAHVGGQAVARDAVPQAVRPVGVVVAGHDVPGDRVQRAHPLDRLEQRAVGEAVLVVQVARDQHRCYAVRLREAADRRDRLEPCLLQQAHGGIVDEAEDLADLPVGSVDQPQSPVLEARRRWIVRPDRVASA